MRLSERSESDKATRCVVPTVGHSGKRGAFCRVRTQQQAAIYEPGSQASPATESATP